MSSHGVLTEEYDTADQSGQPALAADRRLAGACEGEHPGPVLPLVITRRPAAVDNRITRACSASAARWDLQRARAGILTRRDWHRPDTRRLGRSSVTLEPC